MKFYFMKIVIGLDNNDHFKMGILSKKLVEKKRFTSSSLIPTVIILN